MARKKDLTGQRFGRLVAISDSGVRKNRQVVWTCLCDCGNIKDILGQNLLKGNSKSCGCLARELVTTHGYSRTPKYKPEYVVWQNIRQRCNNPNKRGFENYGGCGVKICPEWDNFENFLKDVGPRPSLKYSIDRINGDGDYEPGNCRWADRKTQALNRRTPTQMRERSELEAFRLGFSLGLKVLSG